MALIPLQTDIEKALTDFVRSEINNNSYGINFSLGFWINTTDREGKNVEIIEIPDRPYATETSLIVPMSIDGYAGNITNIEGIFNADYTIPLSFQINVEDDEHFQNTINAINEFKNNLRGQIKRLSVSHNNVTETFTAVTSTDNLTPEGNLSIMMGETYAFASLTIAFDISKDINYGNQVWVYLAEYDEETGGTLPNDEFSDFTRIFALAPNFSRNNTPESFQNFNSKDVANIIRETSYTFSMNMFIKDDDFHWNLLESVVKNEVLNKAYVLRLEFKNYNISNELVNKFVFQEPVIILDAEPSFSIGEPQYLDISFSKYFTTESIDITDPTTPTLPKLTSPTLSGTITSSFTNPTNDPDVAGVYLTASFTNIDDLESNLRVCIGSQCITQTEVDKNETREFVFKGLFVDTEYVINAVTVSTNENFANSDPEQELFTTLDFPSDSIILTGAQRTIGTGTSTGFPFTVNNFNSFPLSFVVGFQSTLSAPFLVGAGEEKTFNYVNNNLPQNQDNDFSFLISTLQSYGDVRNIIAGPFQVFIPEIPKASDPEILDISQPFNDTVAQVSFNVRNSYSKAVTIRATITDNPNLTSFNEFQTINVPAFGEAGDTVSYTKQYTSEFGSTKYILAQAIIDGEENSEIVSEEITIQQLRTGSLIITWTPVSDTQKLRYTLTNSRNYPVGYTGGLLLNDISVPNSSFNVSVGTQTEVPANSFIVAEFEDGKIIFDGVATNTGLQLTGDAVSDEYKLLITTVSTNRINSLQTSTSGLLARPTQYPNAVDINTTSTATKSRINFKLQNLEEYPIIARYAIGDSAQAPATTTGFFTTALNANETSEEFSLVVSNINNLQYIYLQSEGGTAAPHLLPNDPTYLEQAITPAPLSQKYTVRFLDFDEEEVKSVEKEEGTLLESSDFPTTIPTEDGYNSNQWINDNDDTPVSIGTLVDSDIDVVRNWEIINYTITYVLNDSTNSENNPTTYNVNSSITFEDATRTGYDFIGWFAESTFVNEVTGIEVGSTGNLTLYAKLEEITLEDIVFTTESTITTITVTATNPASNPRFDTDGADTVVDFGLRRVSDGQVISSRLARTFSGPQSDEIIVVYENLDDSTDFELFGNGTNDDIRTFDTQDAFVESEQPVIPVSTVTPVGDKVLRVKLNVFTIQTITDTITWEINGVSQGTININSDSFTTLSSTLFDTDEVTINGNSQVFEGEAVVGSYSSFIVNGESKSPANPTITELVEDGLNIEIAYI